MKKSIILFALLVVGNVFGQNLDYVPQIAPPSPEAYKLSRYGDIQLQGNTGAFSHSIPIYDINFHGINLPITLSYSSNGVLIDELSGFTGTSWTLNAGGVISRTVRGVADEKAQERWYPDSIEPLNSNAAKIKSYADKDNVTRDSQQDWFFVNIGNISTSFFFDENLNILKSNDDDVRIQYSTIGSILEFKITDKNGNIYILGGNEDFVEKNTMSQDCIVGPKTTYYSAWYLKEIITPNNQKISFAYNSYQQSFISSANYNETYIASCPNDFSMAGFNLIFDRNSSSCRSINQTNSKALSSIVFGDNKATFDYRTDRKDEGSLLLSNISIYNNTKLIKREELIYDEIYNSQKVQDSKLSLNPSIHYRYFLKEINNYDSSNIFQHKHSFDYYNLASLPPRLSWNKDIYGYYNGKSNYSAFDKGLIVNPETVFITRNQASNFTADLSVNPTTAYYGMLKRITYPTKGYSNIEYESNSSNVNGMREIFDSSYLEANKDACGGSSTPEKSFEFISNGQSIHFTSSYTASKCPGRENDVIDFHDVYSVSIHNITNGQNTLIFTGKGRYDKIIKTVGENQPTNEINFSPIKTINNNKYRVTIEADTRLDRVELHVNFKYNMRYEPYTYEVFYGGVRVKSTTDFDGTNNTNKKDYFYNTFVERNTGFTTIKEVNPPKLYDKSAITITCSINGSVPGPIHDAIKLSVNNSSINQLYNTRSQSVGYGIITSISNLNNQNNGYKEDYFHITSDNDSDNYQGAKIYGVPSSNNSEGYSSSLLKSKNFNSNNILLTETENFYNSIKDNNVITNWVFKKDYEYQFPVMDTWLYNYSIERYQNFSRTVKPTKTITKDYLTGGAVTSEVTYNYDSPNHLQLTKQTTTNSKGETLSTEYQYPPDWKGNAMADKLTAQNRISEPITVSQKNGGNVISALYNEYNDFNGIVQKSRVFQKKGSNQFVEGDDVIAYNSYDNYGNITQYTPKNGLPVSIIWGYNSQYPIAKIEGASLSEVNSFIQNLETLSNNGTLTKDSFASLRTALPQAMVTSYIYQPLIGVTSITGPNGQTEYYKYDTANRLEEIRNDKQEVLKTFKYNYKQP